jgi:hypothetical protein
MAARFCDGKLCGFVIHVLHPCSLGKQPTPHRLGSKVAYIISAGMPLFKRRKSLFRKMELNGAHGLTS